MKAKRHLIDKDGNHLAIVDGNPRIEALLDDGATDLGLSLDAVAIKMPAKTKTAKPPASGNK